MHPASATLLVLLACAILLVAFCRCNSLVLLANATCLRNWPVYIYLRLDRALLMRQKDTNLHLTKKRGAGFQKAAQYTEQSNQPDVPVYLFIEKTDTFKARQGSADVVDQEARQWLLQSSSVS